MGTRSAKTTREIVIGIARIKPTGPQIVVQNAADRRTAIGDTRVFAPNRTGSITWAVMNSAAPNSAAVRISWVQPGSTAGASAMGRRADNAPPIYGTKRRIAAIAPHSGAFGRPIAHRHRP